MRILEGEPLDQMRDEARAAYIAVKARQLPPSSVSFETVDMGGVPAALAAPEGAEDGRVLFYIHGSGHVSGGSGAWPTTAFGPRWKSGPACSTCGIIPRPSCPKGTKPSAPRPRSWAA